MAASAFIVALVALLAGVPLASEPLPPTAAQLLENARRLYRALELDDVVSLTELALAQPAATIAERTEAYFLAGSCLVVLGRAAEAEAKFRRLLREDAEFEPPPDTPPEIVAVFRKVQAEEGVFLERAARSFRERDQKLKSLRVIGGAPRDVTRGAKIMFEYELLDPHGLVHELWLGVRRGGASEYTLLKLAAQANARYIVELPPRWSAAAGAIEYVVTAHDAAGDQLKSFGDPNFPPSLRVEERVIKEPSRFYESGWFWMGALAAFAAAGATAYFVAR